jgi:RHS repeat-associated protein
VLTRDAAGRIKSRREIAPGDNHLHEYTYDDLGRLTDVEVDAVLTNHYEYDLNGNRTLEQRDGVILEAGHDNQDRLLSYGNLLFTYTRDGALESKTDTQTSATTFYTYDLASNLLRVDLPFGDVLEYVVDASGRRLGRKLNGAFTNRWVYGADFGPAAEVDATGAVVTRYVYAMHAWVPSYMIRGGQTYAILTDAVGSVRLVVNSGTGDVVQRLEYDAYGRVLLDTNPGYQPFGFGGGFYEPLSGFVRLGARDYDAVVGRWTSKDPILFRAGDTNLYGYAWNDPINNIDPSGLESLVIMGAGAVGAISLGGPLLAMAAVGVGAVCIASGACGDLWDTVFPPRDRDLGQAIDDALPRPPFGPEPPRIPPIPPTAPPDFCNPDRGDGPITRNDGNQEAVIDLAKDAKNKGGVNPADAQTLLDWAKEYKVKPVRGPESHPNRPHGKTPHIHVGPVNHIPVKP